MTGGSGASRRRSRFGVDPSIPFSGLALTHVLATGGDALIALVLAGSLFFSVDPSGARWRIALYLLFTMAPFAIVGPLIGPAMDRAKGGRRAMLVGSTVGRAVVAVAMIVSAGSNSLLLFPEAFFMLVFAKSYSVAKAAIVPTVVHSDGELVEANSKLQLLAGLAAFAAGVPGAILLLIGGPGAVAALSVLVFLAASVASLRVPVTVVAAEVEDEQEKEELRGAGVRSAASAMGTLRWIVGFVTFLLAFALRGASTDPGLGMMTGHLLQNPDGTLDTSAVIAPGVPPVWHFGVIVALTGIGGLLGAAVAPVIRRHLREELLLFGALVLAVSGGVAGMVFPGLVGQALLAGAIAMAAASGKQAFDAVVQRDAPDANRGRSFARFESRFQVIWVLGAAVPVLIKMPTRLGGAVVMVVAAAAAVFFAIALQAMKSGQAPPQLPTAKGITKTIRQARNSKNSVEE
ncbi:MAG: MFS transporter [Actinomycetes bacterium]